MRAGLVGVLSVILSLLAADGARADQPPHPRDELPLQGDAQLLPEPAFGDLPAIRERRTLRVLVPYSRTNFFFDKGEIRGFAHDVFQEYARVLNAGAKRAGRVTVAFIPVPRDKLIPWLLEGRGDIAAGRLTITPERAALVDFSSPVESDVAEIPVTRKDGPALSTPDSLSGMTVHIRRSSSYFQSLTTLNASLKGRGLPPVRLETVPEHLEDPDLLEKLDDGVIDLVVVDDYKRQLFARIFPDLMFHTGVRLREGADIGWAVRKGSPQLLASLDTFIRQDRKGPNVIAYVERKYFVDNRWIHRASGLQTVGDFERIQALFRRFGEQYAMAWAPLLAQGYQESRLDHAARSPVGAVGIMQVMPQTAAAPPILLPDVHQLETNIHAGAKYMRFLLDRYFDEPAIAPDDRFRFALAAYNAGPNRIRTLRERAALAGFDPNVWYDNVEIVVAKHVGQEPVTYVGNIDKYLYAFQRARFLSHLREAAGGGTP